MSFTSKIFGTGFQYDHEKEGFEKLSQKIGEVVDASNKNAWLLGNVNFRGCEADALFVMEPNVFLLFELKHYQGSLMCSPNKFEIDGSVQVKGGTYDNPFVQVKVARRILNSCLKGTPFEDKIKALVLFTKGRIHYNKDNRFFPNWFLISDIHEIQDRFKDFIFKGLNFNKQQFDDIFKELEEGKEVDVKPERKAVQIFQKLGFRESFNKLRNYPVTSMAGKAVRKVEQFIENISIENKFSGLIRKPTGAIDCLEFAKLNEKYSLLVLKLKYHDVLIEIGDYDYLQGWVEKRRGMTFLFDNFGKLKDVTFKTISEGAFIDQDNSAYFSRIKGFNIDDFATKQFHRKFLMKINSETEQEEIDDFFDTLDGESVFILKNMLSHLQDGKAEQAQEVLEYWKGNSVAVSDMGTSMIDPLVSEENTDNLFDLKSYEDWKKFLDPLKFQKWMLLLHPNQKRLVDEDYDSPVRLHGVSGSGKTSVLVHRAVRLAREADEKQKILLVTLSDALSDLIEGLVSTLCEHEPPKNLIIMPYYMLCAKVVDEMIKSNNDELFEFCQLFDSRTMKDGIGLYDLIKDSCASNLVKNLSFSKNSFNRERWQSFYNNRETTDNLDQQIISKLGQSELSGYIWDEISLIRSVSLIQDEYGAYLNYTRRDRIFPFNPLFRKQALEKLKIWEEEMLKSGFVDELLFTQILNYLANEKVEFPAEFRFHSVLVDEYQDLSTFDINFLLSLTDRKQNGFFITGDVAQKINAKQFYINKVIPTDQLVDRRLLKNYRNSKQILEMAYGMIDSVLGANIEKQTEDLRILKPEYASKNSPKPFLVKSNDPIGSAWEFASEWEKDGNAAFTTCIVTVNPNKISVDEILKQASNYKCEGQALTGDYMKNQNSFVVSELEQVKGFEFMQVLILGAEKEMYPCVSSDVDVPLDEHERDLLKLYVGITRARDEVRFIFEKESSPFLSNVVHLMTEISHKTSPFKKNVATAPSDDLPNEPVSEGVGGGQTITITGIPLDCGEGNGSYPGDSPQGEEERGEEDDERNIPELEDDGPFENIGGLPRLQLIRPVTVKKLQEALGRDPKKDINVSHHLEVNVAKMFFHPTRDVVADSYVFELLSKYNCTAHIKSEKKSL